jgi:cytochrome c-type biogenesis protein CcmH/NrfF
MDDKRKESDVKSRKAISVFATIHHDHYSEKDHEEIAEALRCMDLENESKSEEAK